MTPDVRDPDSEFLALQEQVAGRFSLVRELGRGGMGVVFLARDLALDRLVAIKLLPPQLSTTPEARDHFVREARTAAGLAHPHIVPVHAVESSDRLTFFVMGYVDGETLGQRIRREGPLAPSEAMRIVQEVAWALGHAHANGIVHRDVKPDNILLERGSGRALVTDFGIAHALGSATPSDGVARGTPEYVSPEVVQGAPGDARSDLYSLGVTAWVASTGRLPFSGSSAAAMVLAHVQSEAPSLVGASRVPPRFALAVDRCLLKLPDERWPSAEAFAAAVESARSRPPQVPAPVRAFLREWESAGDEITTAGTASLVALTESLTLHLLQQFTSGAAQFDYSILKWVFAIIAVLTAGLANARAVPLIAHARGVLRAGFDHARLLRAQTLDATARADERAASDDAEGGERSGALLLLGGTVVGSVLAFAAAFSDGGGWLNVAGGAGAVILPTLALRALSRLRARTNESPPWSRALRGPFGKLLFKLAGGRAIAGASAGALEGPEPTAIALGDAARALLESLPRAVRSELGDGVPALIDELEQRALAASVEAGDAAGSPATGGFTSAVRALETLRLDLLRLSVGSITAPELTAALARVREFGAAVDRRLEARADVEALLARTPTRS